jgi:hypothetical protein
MALVYMGERFGVPPWDIEQAPADRVEYYLSIMGVEGEMQALLDGLGPEDELIMDDRE